MALSVKFLNDEHEKLSEHQHQKKYGPLYEELDLSPEKKHAIIAFRVSFLLRRIIIIVALLMTTQLWMQILLAIT